MPGEKVRTCDSCDLSYPQLNVGTVTRKDDSTVENVNLQVQDDTAEATLGLWGTSALSPSGIVTQQASNTTNPEAVMARQSWKAGETVLLLQAPGWKIGRSVGLQGPPKTGR